jgi:hypothetical protein
MNVIVIYHHPQECGSPYLTFISQSTGEVVDTVTIPDGYYYTGCERIKQHIPVFTFTEQVHQSPIPTTDTKPRACYLPNPHHYEYKVTKVTDVKEDKWIFPTWEATLHVTAYLVKEVTRWSTHLDTFRKQMEASGFDMKGWCLYKRMRTPLLTFLKQVTQNYKDYHLINLIEIG